MGWFTCLMALLFALAGCTEDGGDDDGAWPDDDTTPGDDDDTAEPSDVDGDGWTVTDGDCDDNDATVHPWAVEVPLDGTDQNCDGEDRCFDLDCDSYPDIVFSNSTNGVQGDIDSFVYWGGSDGYSEEVRTDLPTWNATFNAIADLDLDGYLDVVFANHHAAENHATGSYIYWGGPGELSPAHRSALETVGAKGVSVADLDADGFPDVVVSNGFDGATHLIDSYVYWGSAEGFSADDRAELPTSGAAGNAIADLDADGYLDIVFASHHDDYSPNIDSFIYWGGAEAYDEARRTGLPTSMAIGVSVADLDGDGWQDIVFSNNRDGESYAIDSFIYWGGEDGFGEQARDELPTHGAVGVSIAAFVSTHASGQ